MNIIEQAARRLEELQRSGVEVPRRSGLAPGSDKEHERADSRRHAARAGADRDTGKSSKEVAIDFDRLMTMGYITPSNSRSQIANEFRIIKRPVLTNINGQVAGVLGVIGPTRMAYSRIIPLVTETARQLSKGLKTER